jgi:protein-tyrosine-phosphatase
MSFVPGRPGPAGPDGPPDGERTRQTVSGRRCPLGGGQAASPQGVPGVSGGDGYTPHVHFLFVCTANICRSPMAAALFAEWVERLSDPVEVSSAGVRAVGELAGREVPHEVLEVMIPYGIDLSAHRSRALTQPMVEDADLIIGMSRRHVQEAILMDPPSWPKSFMLKELVRRGEELGHRRSDQGFRSWIDLVHGDRTRQSLVHRSRADDIEDPYGRPLAEYRSTSAELAGLIGRLATLLWPDAAVPPDVTSPP